MRSLFEIRNFSFISSIPLVIFCMAQSCAPSIHVPNTTNTPNLSKKFECNVNGYVGIDHAELQTAFSPAKNIGMFINGYSYIYDKNNKNTNFLEGAFGYYHHLIDSTLFLDLYGGYGYGQREHHETSGSEFLAANNVFYYDIATSYNKAFIQTALFFKQKNFQSSLSVQGYWLFFNYMNVNEKQIHYISNYITVPFELDKKYGTPTIFNYNVGITNKFGWKNFKFIVQTAITSAISTPVDGTQTSNLFREIYFNKRFFEVNIGLQYSFKPERKFQ